MKTLLTKYAPCLLSTLSASGAPASDAKLALRARHPTAPARMLATMSVPNSAALTASPSKACTDCTMPLLLMKVPTMQNANARQALMTAQHLNRPCLL